MLRIFSIHDSGVNTFSPPFFVNHVQIALRYFETLAKDPKSDISKYPSSFTLFELGEFEEETGAFNLHTVPLNLGMASSFIKQE